MPLNTFYLIKSQSRIRWQGSGWKEGPKEELLLNECTAFVGSYGIDSLQSIEL